MDATVQSSHDIAIVYGKKDVFYEGLIPLFMQGGLSISVFLCTRDDLNCYNLVIPAAGDFLGERPAVVLYKQKGAGGKKPESVKVQVMDDVYLDPSPQRRFSPLWLNMKGFANSTHVALTLELGSEDDRPFFHYVDEDRPLPVSKVTDCVRSGRVGSD